MKYLFIALVVAASLLVAWKGYRRRIAPQEAVLIVGTGLCFGLALLLSGTAERVFGLLGLAGLTIQVWLDRRQLLGERENHQ